MGFALHLGLTGEFEKASHLWQFCQCVCMLARFATYPTPSDSWTLGCHFSCCWFVACCWAFPRLVGTWSTFCAPWFWLDAWCAPSLRASSCLLLLPFSPFTTTPTFSSPSLLAVASFQRRLLAKTRQFHTSWTYPPPAAWWVQSCMPCGGVRRPVIRFLVFLRAFRDHLRTTTRTKRLRIGLISSFPKFWFALTAKCRRERLAEKLHLLAPFYCHSWGRQATGCLLNVLPLLYTH